MHAYLGSLLRISKLHNVFQGFCGVALFYAGLHKWFKTFKYTEIIRKYKVIDHLLSKIDIDFCFHPHLKSVLAVSTAMLNEKMRDHMPG
jgi:hypothetical protein